MRYSVLFLPLLAISLGSCDKPVPPPAVVEPAKVVEEKPKVPARARRAKAETGVAEQHAAVPGEPEPAAEEKPKRAPRKQTAEPAAEAEAAPKPRRPRAKPAAEGEPAVEEKPKRAPSRKAEPKPEEES